MAQLETIAPDEAERFEALAQKLVAALAREPDGRTLHLRQHGNVTGTLQVTQVEGALAQGLFARPGTYETYVRFSAGSPRRQADKVPDIRGLAVKVYGVDGPKVIPGLEAARTQDFLCIPSSTFAFPTPEEFIDVALAGAGGPLKILGAIIKHEGFFKGLKRAGQLKSALDSTGESLGHRTFHTAVPILFGETAAKVRFRGLQADGPRDIGKVTEELHARLKAGPLRYALEAQAFVDQTQTPIEHPEVEWSSPWQALGTLEIPATDVASPRGQAIAAYVESLSFDPWHALKEHRPLGPIMRARGPAYRVSTMRRKARPELEVVAPSQVA
ncbi:MAG: hypothetical protein K1X89_24825 [Myxococcaceae bacterium]|nr:hypothetical protein [Myxococcaceae bacterium]